ncbi:MAG TPA: phosphatidate cytidylyltransferase [Gammaproteobacteria bacterium]|nr:phosphatidate cytidylyltransferase [Gammaproteobacteria bacterium]
MLKTRILTALVIAPLAIAGVFFLPEVGFAVFVALIMAVGAWEWALLAGYTGIQRILYAVFVTALLPAAYFVPSTLILALGALWWLAAFVLVLAYPSLVRVWSSTLARSTIGLFVLIPAWQAMLLLKTHHDSNYLILLLFLLIWGADIGAYFSGKAFGKRKLAQDVSPGKSWAGFFGGLVTALAIAIAMSLIIQSPDILSIDGVIFLVGCVVVAMVSVLGDLSISMFKRNAGVKDSSNLLPGHGGFLDRIDSLTSAGPVFALFIMFYGWAS